MPEPKLTIRIQDQDGEVVHLVGQSDAGSIDVIASMVVDGQTLVLRDLHADGSGSGTLGIAQIRAFARELGRLAGATMVEIRGGRRTTGAAPGKVPRVIRINVVPPEAT